MNDTPETDAAYKNHDWDMHDYIPLEFCQKLERERDEWKTVAHGNLLGTIKELADAAQENARLRAIFPEILVSLNSGGCSADCSIEFFNEIPKEVRLVRQKLEWERDKLIKAAEAVIERWESPKWKEAVPTAYVLNALYNVVANVKGGEK